MRSVHVTIAPAGDLTSVEETGTDYEVRLWTPDGSWRLLRVTKSKGEADDLARAVAGIVQAWQREARLKP